jgi:hypothetical protein
MQEYLVCLLVIHEIESQILGIFEPGGQLPFWLSRTGLICRGDSFNKIMDSKIIFQGDVEAVYDCRFVAASL